MATAKVIAGDLAISFLWVFCTSCVGAATESSHWWCKLEPNCSDCFLRCRRRRHCLQSGSTNSGSGSWLGWWSTSYPGANAFRVQINLRRTKAQSGPQDGSYSRRTAFLHHVFRCLVGRHQRSAEPSYQDEHHHRCYPCSDHPRLRLHRPSHEPSKRFRLGLRQERPQHTGTPLRLLANPTARLPRRCSSLQASFSSCSRAEGEDCLKQSWTMVFFYTIQINYGKISQLKLDKPKIDRTQLKEK